MRLLALKRSNIRKLQVGGVGKESFQHDLDEDIYQQHTRWGPSIVINGVITLINGPING